MKSTSSVIALAAASVFLVAGCADGGDRTPTSASAAAARAEPKAAKSSAPELGAWGVDLTAVDESVKPGDDFFRYVNGNWLKTFEIPSDFTNYGSFTVLFERSETRVAEIVDSAARSDATPIEKKIADFYAAYMNTDEIERRGFSAIAEDFAYFDQLADHDAVARAMARPDLGAASPIAPYVSVDAKQTDRQLVHLTQAGIALPSREYYVDERFADARANYLAYIGAALDLAGARRSEGAPEKILALETKIAEIHWPLARQRDPVATYNLVTLADLERDYKGFPWRLFFETAGAGNETEFIVNEREAIIALADLFAQTPVEVWRDYLKLHYLINYASVLPASLDEATFNLFGKALHGQQQQRDRRKRAIAAINDSLGEAVGKLYVDRYFPPEARREMDMLVDNVIAAFDERIRNLDWMSDETKAEALTKLSKFKPFVVGPKIWRDYADLAPTPDNALENMKRSNASTWRYYADRLGKPVDPENQWGMTPQIVNAYYSPPNNAIFFPAAILQPPFFDPNADPAVNYGGIAAVIGHEIGHGFDDQGSKSDGDGLLRNWWADADAKNFAARTDALGKQYATYVPVDDIAINPDLTMGENVGDLGGLTVAYRAYRNSLRGEEAPVIDGLTGDQRFFLAYGQIWRRKYTDADLRHRMYADPHSPSEFRVNGIVRNMDAWYEAFDVKPGDKLYLAPDERVRIW